MMKRYALLVAIFAGAATIGAASVASPTTALGLAAAVGALATLTARPSLWIALAAASPWITRPLTVAGLAPRFADFADFAFVGGALGLAALQRRENAVHEPAIARRCVAVAFAIVCSGIVNQTPLARTVGGLAISMQPFLLILAIVLARPTEDEGRRMLRLVLVLATLQLPVALAQWIATRDGDSVKGTLLGAGAGHHVMAGGVVVAALIGVAVLRRPAALALMAGAVAVTVMADARQVLFLLPLALLVLTLGRDPARSAGGQRLGMIVLAALASVVVVSYGATSIAVRFLADTARTRGGKIAVARVMADHIRDDPVSLFFGFGPGETVSRFAFLTTPELEKAGSPADVLGLAPGRLTATYQRVANPDAIGSSSFTSAQSSALGVIGDYGLLGAAAFSALVVALVRQLWRKRTALAGSALASWSLLVPLMVIYDWLEQPAFTLWIAAATGLALVASPVSTPPAQVLAAADTSS